MSAQRILFNRAEDTFQFDDFRISKDQLLTLMAPHGQPDGSRVSFLTGLTSPRSGKRKGGKNEVTVGGTVVTVSYLCTMLAFLDEYGWFWDNVGSGKIGGHYFDYNAPTPGANWKKVSALLGQWKLLVSTARKLRKEGLGGSADKLVGDAGNVMFQMNQLLKEEYAVE